ncbi:hypothetical protein ABIQ69_04650 [Agromyces sp. G08B096]|uniref:Integral membrane protein n=1 Tax=Agromyces sp. G08B096 TaxID=3156399 RepID=A0AAU7WBY7_9MICO
MAKLTVEELEARLARLEEENAALRAAATEATGPPAEGATTAVVVDAGGGRRRSGRWRSVLSAVLVVLALVLMPVAAISAWARLELVDTDRFVATFAPLAEDPAVQAYVADTVTTAIDEQVDLEGLTSDVFDGVRSLGLPPRAEQALALLEGPAAQGLQALVSQIVDRIVTSEEFADLWAGALRVSHQQAIAAIQGDPDAALEIGATGELSIQLGPVIDAVKQRLIDRGIGFAEAIPPIDRSIVIAESDAFTLVQTVYALAVAVGTWLPWVVLAMLVAGVLVARRRANAVVWTAAGFALTAALFAAGVGIGRLFFVGTVSPSIMPSAAADALYEHVIATLRSTIVAALVLGLLTAVIAWCAGPSRPARSLRRFSTAAFGAVRGAGERYGVTTGAFGRWLDQWRTALYVVIAVVAALVVLVSRPLTTGTVVTTVLVALLVLLLVELLRRPATDMPVADMPVADVPSADRSGDDLPAEASVVGGTGRAT